MPTGGPGELPRYGSVVAVSERLSARRTRP